MNNSEGGRVHNFTSDEDEWLHDDGAHERAAAPHQQQAESVSPSLVAMSPGLETDMRFMAVLDRGASVRKKTPQQSPAEKTMPKLRKANSLSGGAKKTSLEAKNRKVPKSLSLTLCEFLLTHLHQATLERRNNQALKRSVDELVHIPKHISPWSLIERSNRAAVSSQRAGDTGAETVVAPQVPLMPLPDDDDDGFSYDDDNDDDDDAVGGSGNYSSAPLRFSADPLSCSSEDSAAMMTRVAASGSLLGVCALQAKSLLASVHMLQNKLGISSDPQVAFALREAKSLALALDESMKLAQDLECGWQRDWNGEYLRALGSPNRAAECAKLLDDFHQSALLYGSLLISERGLEERLRTVKPNHELGGVAGGEKMMIHGLFFKLCANPDHIYGPDDFFCRKPAGLELLATGTLLQFRSLGLLTPLMCIIDFKGVRVSCQTVVPIDGSNTLVLGSCDAGRNVIAKDPTAFSIMSRVGAKLGLAQHQAGSESKASIVGPADVELHRGNDGQLYAIDLHRLFPPTSDKPHKFLYCHFRPEAMARWIAAHPGKPLSSDVYSQFSSPSDPSSRRHENNVRDALKFVKHKLVPACALELEQCPDQLTHEALVQRIHSHGLGVRFLGLVYRHIKRDELRQLVVVEMVARVLKRRIVTAHASITKQLTGLSPFVNAVVDLFNATGDAPMMASLLADTTAYFSGLRAGEPAALDVARARLLTRVAALTGVELVPRPRSAAHRYTADGDIVTIRPLLKTIPSALWESMMQ